MAQEENKDQPPLVGESLPSEPYDADEKCEEDLDDDEKCDPDVDHGEVKADPECEEKSDTCDEAK